MKIYLMVYHHLTTVFSLPQPNNLLYGYFEDEYFALINLIILELKFTWFIHNDIHNTILWL